VKEESGFDTGGKETEWMAEIAGCHEIERPEDISEEWHGISGVLAILGGENG
jgi:hypothetical protein